MNPTEQQLRPILSIDLGASYTKLAWRPRWQFQPRRSLSENRFMSPSEAIKIDGALLVPSLVLNPGEGREWQFGNDAAQSTPGRDALMFRNWKATLFNPSATPTEIERDTQAATRFLEWLAKKLRGRYSIDQALVRICVPELQIESLEIGVSRLLKAFENAGWSKSQWTQVAEPKANVLGLASGGRNHVNLWPDSPPRAFLPTIYDSNSPLLRVAKRVSNGGSPIQTVMIDIGAFTTDIALCAVAEEVSIRHQRSFKHGVARLDDDLRAMIRANGIDTDGLSHAEFEITKRSVYEGNASQWVVGNQSATLAENSMLGAITQFADDLLDLCREQTDQAQWFIVTGGGSEIPAILERIRSKLEAQKLDYVQDLFPELDQRIATALGGASVVLDFSDQGESTVAVAVQQPLGEGRPCTCGGTNPSCRWCGGEAWIPETYSEPQPRRTVSALDSTEQTTTEVSEHIQGTPKPDSTAAPTAYRRVLIPRTASNGPQEPEKPIEVSAVLACWRGNERAAMQKFSLEGWMGELVFEDGTLSADRQRCILQDHSSATGKAAWLRLLSLGTFLGVRSKPEYIETFWENKLPDVWKALIPTDLKSLTNSIYDQQLDEVFVKAIHREFNDRQATGEDAELWRRVFYDFRKLHHFVYRNDLPCTLLELAAKPGLKADSLVHFLKSGFLPDQKPWVGAIGQSMTAPLLFILRELRRLRMIDDGCESSCFYMNSPTRRVARQLGWITERESAWFDIESLVEMSRACYHRMKVEMSELLPFFDLPLQWYAHNNS